MTILQFLFWPLVLVWRSVRDRLDTWTPKLVENNGKRWVVHVDRVYMGEHGIVIINQMNVLTPANTCWKCKTGIVESTEDTRTMRVGKHTVQVTAPSWTCRSCGEVVYLAIDMMIIEHNLAKKLVQGPPDAKVFSFCRKVMGMNRWRVTLAFEVSEAVVRSWEDGSMEIPKDQWKHLQDLVLNHQVI